MPISLNLSPKKYTVIHKKGTTMCFILTIIMFGFAIQNLLTKNWLTGAVQLIIALGFLLLIINNIQRTRCEKNGTCYTGCSLTNWMALWFKKK
ncbi:MAG: Unknown protein [uncultured Sulfurovum sp.]|uniref:Uncharacterized protein n=1 Tax=uncultured Sulfurovum sp. TaxID=269237 RepID=A0A6S6TQ79_9BACT|nr:MAG: Unknown protein [uncultured Sulfurovum sp.]